MLSINVDNGLLNSTVKEKALMPKIYLENLK